LYIFKIYLQKNIEMKNALYRRYATYKNGLTDHFSCNGFQN